jgi:hypothetical protein
VLPKSLHSLNGAFHSSIVPNRYFSHFPLQLIAKTHLVQATEVAFPANASAKPDGKVKTAEPATNKSINVSQAAPTTDTTTSKLDLAFATATGLATTVHKLSAVWTAARMESVSRRVVAATPVGLELYANN